VLRSSLGEGIARAPGVFGVNVCRECYDDSCIKPSADLEIAPDAGEAHDGPREGGSLPFVVSRCRYFSHQDIARVLKEVGSARGAGKAEASHQLD
jgi:hypothetical protein